MIESELRAAADRLQRGVYQPIPEYSGPLGIQRTMADAIMLSDAWLAEHPIWTDEQCFALNASQHDSNRHPYTCGNDSNHRPLIATRSGWRCADCGYRQDWSLETRKAVPDA